MAIASLVISIIVAVAVVYREFIHDRIFKPKLEIQFSLDEPISRVTTVEYLAEPQGYKLAFWPRLRVRNNGLRIAHRCVGMLDEMRKPDGSLDTRYDPIMLRWAIAPLERGLQPLDIERGRTVDLNTFTTIDGLPNADFATYPDARGIPLYLEPGHHWLLISIYGENFSPFRAGYAVYWDGKDYTNGVKMREMKKKPAKISDWPFPIDDKSTEI